MSLFLDLNRFGGKCFAFHHLLVNGSSAVNGCRQHKSPHNWYKYHNTPQVSSPSINILWSKNPSIIHNNDSPSEKCHPRLSSYIKIQRHICLQLTWNVFAWKRFWTFFAWSVPWCHDLPWFFKLEKAVLWIEVGNFLLHLFLQTGRFSLHEMLIDGLECDVITCDVY